MISVYSTTRTNTNKQKFGPSTENIILSSTNVCYHERVSRCLALSPTHVQTYLDTFTRMCAYYYYTILRCMTKKNVHADAGAYSDKSKHSTERAQKFLSSRRRVTNKMIYICSLCTCWCWEFNRRMLFWYAVVWVTPNVFADSVVFYIRKMLASPNFGWCIWHWTWSMQMCVIHHSSPIFNLSIGIPNMLLHSHAYI